MTSSQWAFVGTTCAGRGDSIPAARLRRAGPGRARYDRPDLEGAMRLEPLYRTVFRYPDGGRGTVLEGEAGSEGHYFFVAEGTVEGRVNGRLTGANHPRSRVDKNALPNIQGAIETEDGATIV